ncbi:MAG: TrkH family potassium uptake protein [Rhodobiaceae bacterium]|nr:TrkH family potassium uptake protein [Rhodobiaceae bacterium]
MDALAPDADRQSGAVRPKLIDFGPVFQVLGLLLSTLGCAMMVPAIVDLSLGSSDWIVFVSSALVTLFFGVSMWATTRGAGKNLSLRQAFILTNLAWAVIALFGALPLRWSELGLSFADAYFESMSGLTTTGSTVIVGLDGAPPGVLLWRGILQWLGGLGIVVMAIAVMPMLQVGGMQLFRVEAFYTSEKILPRATQISGNMTMLYIVFTALCAIAYDLAGMSFFDAVIHAMTTISTGGYSTHDASMGYFDSAAIDLISVLFMIIGSLPFILFLKTLSGARGALFQDSQVRVFLITLFVLVALTSISHIIINDDDPVFTVRHTLFNLTSIITGTGYGTLDHHDWGAFSIAFFFIAMFSGGCAGSTSCGIKIFRLQVVFENLRQHLKRILYPNGIFPKLYNGQPLSDSVVAAVMTFLFLYFLSVIIVGSLLQLTGLDPLTAFSAAATAVSNVGPGAGPMVGPDGNFSGLTDTAKWLLSFAMLLGRLELLTVLVLFMPRFWMR